MKPIERRIKKLESLCFPAPDPIWISCRCDAFDDEAELKVATEAALAEWEAQNGPVGDREVTFIVTVAV